MGSWSRILGSPVPGAAGSVPTWWDLGLCPGSASDTSVSICHTCLTGQFEEKMVKYFNPIVMALWSSKVRRVTLGVVSG